MNEVQRAVEPSPGERSAVATRSADERREFQALLADLWQHSETLLRQEVELLKAEVEARSIHAKAAVQRGAISLGLFHAAYMTSLAALVLMLALWVEPWAAALIVAIAASAGAFAFYRLGKRELQRATALPEPRTRHEQHHGHLVGRQRAHS